MSHARIEEVSDSDPEIDDPDDFDPGDAIIAPANIPRPRPPQPSSTQPASQPQPPAAPSRPFVPKINKEAIKTYQMLYPVYFDASRTRATGRRVPLSLAVRNPLARTIVDAVQAVCGPRHQIPIAFEPDKLHPKDWANPGRVRIHLMSPKTTPQQLLHPVIKNKRHLYRLVAAYLQAHPTTETSPLELRISGLEVPEKLAKPAVPRGWKINDILPLHSPAMSGGGVSENFFKDMMAEMQGGGGAAGGQLPPGMASMLNGMGGSSGGGGDAAGSGGEAKKKKEKKKGKA